MERTDTMADWRTVQLFLSASASVPAVYEVEIDMDGSANSTRCSCPTFKSRKNCRHTKFVNTRMKSNDGHYPLMVHENAEKEDISQTMATPESFRDFVVRYGKIEVL